MAEQTHTYSSQAEFASSQPKEGSPETEFLQRPDRFFGAKFFNKRFEFPDGSEHEMWCFESDESGRGFPAPLVRATEGELLHMELKPGKGPHTVHLHGMEADPRNDGAGHTSFEVTGGYTYQWRPQAGVPGNPNVGTAGTYFYHCHVNTVLHVQMGMFGPMIIDPVAHPDFPVEAGARRSFVDGPLYDIATETMLAAYATDARWHEMGHAAGQSGEDVGLDRFEPKHFYVLGGDISTGPPRDGVWTANRVRANVAGSGRHPTLLRAVNANYFPSQLRFTTRGGDPVRMAEVISHDGRPFRDTSNRRSPSVPLRDRENRLMTSRLAFGAAERYDLLLHPPRAGRYLVHIDYFHWVPRTVRRPIATRTIPIVAS